MVQWNLIRTVVPTALGLLLCLGCGGNGSSGFDAGSGSSGFDSAFAVEQEAIDQVNQDGGCRDAGGAFICAPDAADGGHGTVTEFLTIDPPSGSEVPCVEMPAEDLCTFTVALNQLGFPEGSRFFAAVRLQDENSYWTSGLSPFVADSEDPASLDLTVHVQRLPEGGTVLMQVAVLVYFPESDLPPPSAGDLLLRDFGADLIYAVTDLSVLATSVP